MLVAAAALLAPAGAHAQLATPNPAGVAMGHLHFQVKDVEATRRFWLTLGGRVSKSPGVTAIVFPDVIVVLSQGVPSGGTDGSVVNHVAFRVRSFAEVEAAGLAVQRLKQFPGVGSVTTPDGERIELFENAATNLTFTPDEGPIDAVASRHNRPQEQPIAFHHIHLYVPEGEVAAAKAWYATVFGGTPGKRSTYDAVDLPGVNINISAAPKPVSTTDGRALDRIGFEVEDLRGFDLRLRGLRALSLTHSNWRPELVPVPTRPDERNGHQAQRLIDPWGTVIELTQGLRRY
jgi:catechol 2,3-dioxygenase-like lactoylglutathione lyase family enzyme